MKKILPEGEILDQVKDAVVVIDNDHTIVYLNKAAAEQYGVNRDVAVGLKVTDLYKPSWFKPKEEQEAYASIEERGYWTGEIIHVKKNGVKIYVKTTISVLKDESGKRIGTIDIIQDITRIKQTEYELRQSEKKFRTLAEHSPQIITRWDKNLRYAYIAPAVKNLTGQPPEFFIGKNIEEIGIAPKDLLEANATVLNKVFTTGQSQTREFNFTTSEGIRVLHWHVVPEFADDGTVETVLSFTSDITSQKQLEERLTEEIDMLKGIMENAGVMLAYFDTNFNFAAVNSAYAIGSGHSVEELIGNNHFSLFPNEENQTIFEQVRNTGEAVEYHDKPFEFVDQPERGITYWSWKLAPVKNEKGHVIGLVLSLRETTKRKKAEDALRKSEEQNRMILESITDSSVAFNHEWRYTYVNSTAAKILHKTREELLGQVVWEAFPEAVKLKFWTELNRAVKERIPIHFEEFYPEPLNAWYECHCYPTPDGLAVFFSDITERKKTEKVLRESEALFRALVEQNIIGIIAADVDRITYANDAFLKTVGYIHEDMEKGRIRWIEMTPIEYRDLDERALEEIISKGSCTPFEKEYICKDGSRVPILIGGSLLQREPLQWVCFVMDITERKRMEEKIQDYTLHLEELVRERTLKLREAERLATIGETASMVGHDIRNPLQAIIGVLYLAM